MTISEVKTIELRNNNFYILKKRKKKDIELLSISSIFINHSNFKSVVFLNEILSVITLPNSIIPKSNSLNIIIIIIYDLENCIDGKNVTENGKENDFSFEWDFVLNV